MDKRNYKDVIKHRILLNLAQNNDVKTFELTSDIENYNQITVNIETQQQIYNWGLQVLHYEDTVEDITKKTLTDEQPNNYFNFNRYIDDTNFKNLILFTNRKSNLENGDFFGLIFQNQYVIVTVKQITMEFNPKIFNQNYCYQFVTSGDEPFFNKLILCTNQNNFEQFENENKASFCRQFHCDCDIYENFEKYQRNTRKFTKNLIRIKLAETLLTPHIQIYPRTPVKCNSKVAMIAKISKNFDIITMKNSKFLDHLYGYYIKNLPQISKFEFSDTIMDELKIVSKFGDFGKHFDMEVLLTCWHSNLLPIIIELRPQNRVSVYKAINLTKLRKFILITDYIERRNLPNFQIFENLVDCQINRQLCDQIIDEFQIGIQRRLPQNLRLFVDENPNILKMLTVDDLLEMANRGDDNKTEIGEIQRYFPKNLLSIRILTEFDNGKDLFVINCLGRAKIMKQIPGIESMDVFQYLRYNFDLNQTKMVLISKFQIRRRDFDEICRRNSEKNCHLLQLIDENYFEWLYSNHSIVYLRQYRKKSNLLRYTEYDIFNYFNYNRVAILSAGPAMGKTWIAQQFTYKAPIKFWVISIDLAQQFPFLRSDGTNEEILESIFLIQRETPTDEKFRKLYQTRRRIIFIWDQIDRLQNGHLKNSIYVKSDNIEVILKIIRIIHEFGYFQCIVTRDHLKEKFENEFNVLAFEIENQLETQQFIAEKLNDKSLLSKVNKSIHLSNYYLNIPTYLNMLIELLNRDSQRYQILLCQTPNLFYIIQSYLGQKIEDFYKKSLVMFNETSEICLRDVKKYRWARYEGMGVRACFGPDICEKLGLKYDYEFINDLQTDGYPIGIILKTNAEFYPIFSNYIYAEFFAVSWFLRKIKTKTKLMKDFIFLPQYKNIRFLFDLAAAGQSLVHLDVLYKNLQSVKTYHYNLPSPKDNFGRTPLHLAVSYGETFPILTDNNILHTDLSSSVQNDEEYQELVKYLAGRDEIIQKDYLNSWSCLTYAQYAHCLSSIENLAPYITEIKLETYKDIPTIIYYAILFNYTNLFQIFIKKIQGVFNQEPDSTILHLAAELGRTDFVKELIKKGIPLWRKFGKNEANNVGCTPVYLAAKNGHLDIVKILTDAGAKITSTNISGWNPLDIAVANGHSEIVQFLLHKNRNFERIRQDSSTPYHWAAKFGYIEMFGHPISPRNLEKFDRNQWTPIHCALRYGRENIIKYLIEYYGILKQSELVCFAVEYSAFDVVRLLLENGGGKFDSKWSPLHTATKCGRLKVVQYLIKLRGVSVLNSIDSKGMAPLHYAAMYGHYNVVQFLLEKGAKVDVENKRFLTPLHIAAINRHIDIVEILQYHGGNIDGIHPSGWTPLHDVSFRGYNEIVVGLYTMKANIDPIYANGFTALHMATTAGHSIITEFLIRYGANVNALSHGVWSPLHSAIQKGHSHVVRKLLEMGSKVSYDNPKWTPLFFAAIYNKIDIMKILIEFGAKTKEIVHSGWTILHYASRKGYLELAQYMIELGADVNGIDRNGDTPLHYAVKHRQLNIAKYLIGQNAKKEWLNHSGQSPLLLALEQKNHEMKKLLEPPIEYKDSTLRRVATFRR